ncbi:hypothetical protein DPMN_092018 [Dreissena polymorpha]|uniref:Uncharacterized protein n=1 Tax=Dreissena polymorpha TaxID=45954 RepID=A0A9D4R192_DREPO|nr:hypothetical protein DPMN_092018 [Dreissena polymorpha]
MPILGSYSHIHKDLISADAHQNIEDRRAKTARFNISRTLAATLQEQEEYTKENRSVKRSIRAEQRNDLETPATEAER